MFKKCHTIQCWTMFSPSRIQRDNLHKTPAILTRASDTICPPFLTISQSTRASHQYQYSILTSQSCAHPEPAWKNHPTSSWLIWVDLPKGVYSTRTGTCLLSTTTDLSTSFLQKSPVMMDWEHTKTSPSYSLHAKRSKGSFPTWPSGTRDPEAATQSGRAFSTEAIFSS